MLRDSMIVQTEQPPAAGVITAPPTGAAAAEMTALGAWGNQLVHVMRKNFLIKKRNRKGTAAEMIYPIYFVLILYLISMNLPKTQYKAVDTFPSMTLPSGVRHMHPRADNPSCRQLRCRQMVERGFRRVHWRAQPRQPPRARSWWMSAKSTTAHGQVCRTSCASSTTTSCCPLAGAAPRATVRWTGSSRSPMPRCALRTGWGTPAATPMPAC